MSNYIHDLTPPEYIPLPRRASVEQFDIIEIDKKGKNNGNNSKGKRQPKRTTASR